MPDLVIARRAKIGRHSTGAQRRSGDAYGIQYINKSSGPRASQDQAVRLGDIRSGRDGRPVQVERSILRAPWNEDLFGVLEGFPELAHDDEVDACSGALEILNPQMTSWGIYELYRQQAEQRQAG